MADITNLSQFLSDIADAIRTKKETTEQIPAENFDTEILSIETGIDTSDATATANDIISGKTAYINGEKITGAIPNNGELNITPSTETQSIPAGYTSGGIVRAVDNFIDENIVAENIKSGVTILGVEGTLLQGENLQEQLDTQDLIIQQLQEELAGKASGSAKPNVFMQETEPTTKDGIWLKGSYQVDNIVADENVFASEEWNTVKMSSLKTIPYNFYSGSAVSIGTNIYLLGSAGNTSTYKKMYKYDTLTDTYTQLTDIPYSFKYGSAVSIGTNIYLFGGSSYPNYAYKYNTLTDTYTQLTNVPYNFYEGSAVSIGTNIYLFGGNGGVKATYKYDTLTDTYTQLTNIPYVFYEGSAVFNGTDVYLLGGNPNPTKVQVMAMIPKDYDNNSIVISQGVPSNKTNIANYGMQNAKFYYDRVYYQNENGELLNTIPTYNGNGTEWVKISGGEG